MWGLGQVNLLNVRVVELLVEYFSLVLFQLLLGVLVLSMQGPGSCVELLVPRLQLSIVDLFVGAVHLLLQLHLPPHLRRHWPRMDGKSLLRRIGRGGALGNMGRNTRNRPLPFGVC